MVCLSVQMTSNRDCFDSHTILCCFAALGRIALPARQQAAWVDAVWHSEEGQAEKQ